MADADKGAPPPQAVLGQMINGYWLSLSIMGAARLGIADALDEGAATPVGRIAERVAGNADAIYRLMRALASAGIFSETGEGHAFTHTPLSRALKKDAPASMHGLATMSGLLHLRAWPEVVHSLKTGHTAFSKVFGKELFEHLPTDPEAARAFDAAMAGYTAMTSAAAVAAYDFARFGSVVDVGGGSGALLAAILGKFPSLRGTTFDLPHVAPRARAFLDGAGLAERAEVVGGDFFQAVPAADGYTLKMILHDWDDESARAILKTLRRSIRDDGRVLVIEQVVPPGNAPSPAKFLDLNMLVMTGGRERTEAEYGALFAAAGFALERVHAAGPIHILEARPA